MEEPQKASYWVPAYFAASFLVFLWNPFGWWETPRLGFVAGMVWMWIASMFSHAATIRKYWRVSVYDYRLKEREMQRAKRLLKDKFNREVA